MNTNRVIKNILPTRPNCDFCSQPASYDGKTTSGPWAYMCNLCFLQHGVGLGTGLGQQLRWK